MFSVPTQEASAVVPAPTELVVIHYIERRADRPPPLNNEDAVPSDEGLRGVELGIKDSIATGRFAGLSFELHSTVVEPAADLRAAFAAIAGAEAPHFVIVNAPASDVLALADMAAAKDIVLLNIGATDTRLRDHDCRANVLHVIPSRAMLSDALMQFLLFKGWTHVLLVSGPNLADVAYAESLRHSAKKFGTKIVADTTFDAKGADIRDSALREFALVTRAPSYDVVAVADETDEFGLALVYNTSLPRPVVGTHGLTPAGWGKPVEAWAAAQLQGRFAKLAGRQMRSIDYAGWLAAHIVGEAAVQLKSADPTRIKALLHDPNFNVGGFKGRALSFRSWNGQLRQPIYLLWPGAVTATAPMEGFLHESTDLDTLGLDKPESACRAMGAP
ncbi:MAG: ABC transporter substrate-binding protein [Beijerinckiaceae bacterium]